MKKIASLIAGISLLAVTLTPIKASAAAATMSLSGATQSNGSFSTVVYENSDGPVTSVSLAMSFSTAVSGVAYDYSVGPFTTTDPSGGHLVQGSVTGSQPVARVTFTLANPGAVTASVNTGSSYLKGVSGTSIVYYTMSPASAVFTYNAPAPAQGGMGGDSSTGSTTTTTSGRSAAVAQSTPVANTSTTAAPAVIDDKSTKTDVKGDATKAKDDSKNVVMAKDTAAKKHSVWPWIILVVVAAVAVAYAMRNRTNNAAVSAAVDKEADAPVVKPTDTAKAAAATVATTAKNGANKKKAPHNNQKSGKKNR